MRRSHWKSPALVGLLLALLLGATAVGWAHAAAHPDESDIGECVTCHWVKHAPAVLSQPSAFSASLHVLPAAPERCAGEPHLGEVRSPSSRAPPTA